MIDNLAPCTLSNKFSTLQRWTMCCSSSLESGLPNTVLSFENITSEDLYPALPFGPSGSCAGNPRRDAWHHLKSTSQSPQKQTLYGGST